VLEPSRLIDSLHTFLLLFLCCYFLFTNLP
jgi:hypothetical protein